MVRMLAAGLLGGGLLAIAAAAPASPPWRDGLSWQGRSATMQAAGEGGWRLRINAGDATPRTVAIAPQPLASDTGSALFDGLFALAQQEMAQDRVDAIRDGAFDHGKPLPCDCFQTGEKWPYVWTRDLSYAADLALARLDPERVRRSLRFKLSDVRNPTLPQGLYVAQDTGSGGSWPISTDRVVWFLAARHLLDDEAFGEETWRALRDTLAQDREYAFDADIGLYRGETSFLDWREQTYPAWTKEDVRFIGESFALSTNVLHYDALRLAATMAARRDDGAAAAEYRAQADALAARIDARFWNERRGMYMSYIGSADNPAPYEAYDLLGISLAVLSGAVPEARAKRALERYPAVEAGSPVVWPQHRDVPVYHNRAIWPFVSAYALEAARKVGAPARIAHELRSLMRGAALAGSNMENYEFLIQAVHVDDGALSGPVVNSPRQLWSVAGYLDMVLRGVFGLEDDGGVAPMIPVELVPMLFGEREAISLRLADRTIELRRPATLDGNLLVAGATRREGDRTIVELRAEHVTSAPLVLDAPQFAPPTPEAPRVQRIQEGWRVEAPGADSLYVDGSLRGPVGDGIVLPRRDAAQCMSATRTGADGLESLHSPTVCIGEVAEVAGDWPRRWTAPRDGRYRVALRYDNRNGPINTGVTAAVKRLSVRCGDAPEQVLPVVMPHSVGEQRSTSATFDAHSGQACVFALHDGFNMSDLRHFARYTGGKGGAEGALNEAKVGAMEISNVGEALP
ncbi:MAG TPA: Six-hairpin glycosidase-like protein [Luteimonas sp.]|nr:Six-hairpin glycosidase-like protein [Luteimonas sp.]